MLMLGLPLLTICEMFRSSLRRQAFTAGRAASAPGRHRWPARASQAPASAPGGRSRPIARHSAPSKADQARAPLRPDNHDLRKLPIRLVLVGDDHPGATAFQLHHAARREGFHGARLCD
jgi:hypothetical protein